MLTERQRLIMDLPDNQIGENIGKKFFIVHTQLSPRVKCSQDMFIASEAYFSFMLEQHHFILEHTL